MGKNKNRTKDALKNAIALLFGLSLAVFIGEVGVRLYVFGWDTFDYQKINSFDNLLRSGLVRNSETSGLGYELQPNFNGYYKLTSFRTNEHGIRDDSYSKSKENNTYRIAIIGDSFTMGTGVSHENLFHTITENQLNALNDSVSCQLINFGVSGYNLDQYEIQLKHKVIHFKPDEVVISFCAYNDNLIPSEETSMDSIPEGLKAEGFWASYLKRFVRFTLFQRYHPKEIKYNEDQLQYVRQSFQDMTDFCHSKGVEISVIYLSNVYKPTESEQIKLISEELGIRFVDTSYRFKDKKLSNYSVNIFDPHPNGKANRLFSEELYQLLKPN